MLVQRALIRQKQEASAHKARWPPVFVILASALALTRIIEQALILTHGVFDVRGERDGARRI